MWKPDTSNQASLRGVPPWRDTKKKFNIQYDIRTLLGRNCEVQKGYRFLSDIEVFEKI